MGPRSDLQADILILSQSVSVRLKTKEVLHRIYPTILSDINASIGGELIFGDVDAGKFTGSISYAPVVIQGYWEFRMNG